MRTVFALLLAVLVVGCQPADDGLTAAASAATENPLASDDASGSSASYIEVESVDALKEAIRDTDAEIVLVNYWATWCGPCRVEFPDLMRYDAEKEGEGVEVRFVSVDMPADAELVQGFLDEQGVTEPTFLYTGPGELIGQIDPLVAAVVPVTMVFDQDGTLLKSHLGRLHFEDIDQLIADATEA
ncbi:MAG: hypothetical protein Rubg2KO_18970 [Rubricoccaceae bacterium]